MSGCSTSTAPCSVSGAAYCTSSSSGDPMTDGAGNNRTGRREADDLSTDMLLLRAAPALVRLGWTAGWRVTEWSFTASIRVSSRVLRAAIAGDPPAEVLQAAGGELRDYLRHALAIGDDGD